MKIVQGQVRGESKDGKDAASEPFIVPGFKPNSIAHVMLTGWSIRFSFGDHPILEMGIWLQQAVYGDWKWCQDVTVHADGTVQARYVGLAGSENRDNPFTFLVNYAVIGLEP